MTIDRPPCSRCCRTKRCCRFKTLAITLPLLFLQLFVLAVFPAKAQTSEQEIRFKLRDGYLMYVPVLVNGSGPYLFLLDTGTSRTVLDPELARQLQAPSTGNIELVGILHSRQDNLVHLQNLDLDGVSVSDLSVVVDKLTRQKFLAPGIRGILGEDFLSRFDFLIDYKQHTVRFGGAVPSGERCQFDWGGDFHGKPTSNRLLIAVQFAEVSPKQFVMQLDTGARIPELFYSGSDAVSTRPSEATVATSNGSNGTTIQSDVTLKVGSTTVSGQDLAKSRRSLSFDSAGLLPASIFHRVYISHSGGFVVLNPTD